MARAKTIIVGDIHGMLDELIELIQLAEYDQEKDRLIFAGDLVDRGPKSAEVISYAEEIGAELCIGNHDDKYIRYRRHEQKKTHVGRKHYRNPMSLSADKQKIWDSLSEKIWITLNPVNIASLSGSTMRWLFMPVFFQVTNLGTKESGKNTSLPGISIKTLSDS